ncbi:MAG TPA: hypothetical protein VFQ91_28060 [Bryobacteraceae bacterium]|nr:hypothetical protein [Bryobacteraceae bacterium]
MTVLVLLAAALPGLFVEGDPAPGIRDAGVECIQAPPAKTAAWSGQCVNAVDPASLQKLPAPGVRYRMNEARASSAPWVDSNGARYLRGIQGKALIAAGDGRAALAAAEAHAFGADVLVTAAPKDWKAFGDMRRFLAALPAAPLPALANIGFEDDGTPAALENMNLLLRRNLLFRVVSTPDKELSLNVKPKGGDPSAFAYEVRQKLTDAKRLLRLYGSEVVVARLFGDASHRRVALLNYSNRVVEGVRIRVLGAWPKVSVHAFGETVEAADIVLEGDATEFTLPRVTAYVVVEMAR